MTVLAAVDFSTDSLEALRRAAKMARDRDQKLVVVHCVPHADESAFWRHLVETPWEVPSQIRRVAKARLVKSVHETLGDEYTDGIEYAVELDSATDGILAVAERVEAQLIVVGATGSGKLQNWVLGSSAERVVRASPIPVLALAPDAPEDGLQTILAPVDFSDYSRASLARAVEMARAERARLLVLHSFVLPADGLALLDLQPPPETVEAYEAQRWAEFDDFVASFEFDQIEHEQLLHVGSPADAIEAVALAEGVDLICMGTHGRTGMRRLVLGSTAARVLRRMPCSVLTVPSPDAP